MNTKKLIALACAFLATVSAQVSLANGDLELIYSGPVEAVNVPSGELSVLGHQFVTRQPAAVAVGSRVNVYGRLLPNGAVASAVIERMSDYAMGSDSIYLKGHVTTVSAQIGRFSIGVTQVDYTALLSDSSFQPPVLGETIEVVGIQPTTRGIVLAAKVYSPTRSAGVIQTGSAAGVIQTGNKLGVIQTGSAAGVIQTGNKLGVIQTGSAAGVIQTGNKLGVIQTGSAAGVIQTGNKLGVIQTGSAAGVIQTGNKLGVIQTGSAAGVIQTGNKLGVIQTGSAAGVIQTGSSFGSLR
jgi:hypothetical protein